MTAKLAVVHNLIKYKLGLNEEQWLELERRLAEIRSSKFSDAKSKQVQAQNAMYSAELRAQSEAEDEEEWANVPSAKVLPFKPRLMGGAA